MIVVKTKNGDRFINDKAVTVVAHDRENESTGFALGKETEKSGRH